MQKIIAPMILATVLAAIPGATLAAQRDTARADSIGTRSLPQMTVTAQRREEAAQNVGIALTPLTGRELSERSVVNANYIQRVVPSLEIVPAFGGGQPQFRLRGVGFSDYASNNSSTVGVYVDNVALPFPVQTQGPLFDLARVEVLRGPQGSLYGRNSTGGAVNFVSNRPTSDRHGSISMEAGSYGMINANGFVSGALSTAVRGRVAAVTQQFGGWQHNRITDVPLGDHNQTALRGQLEWDATSRMKFLAIANGQVDRSEGQGLYLFAPLASVGGNGATIPADRIVSATGWGFFGLHLPPFWANRQRQNRGATTIVLAFRCRRRSMWPACSS